MYHPIRLADVDCSDFKEKIPLAGIDVHSSHPARPWHGPSRAR
jgi:hypothetical protein